ncbi:MAG: pyridoxal-phosphate dependent enzyme [Thermoplasmata archaeon]|nr:pyridoxal-phosphate dependent enzyme [Thermoplasmata archaeon]
MGTLRPPFDSVLDLVGHTPLVALRRITEGLPYRVLVKLEYLNPGGSVKDRIGPAMIADAEAKGLLKPGGTIVEATSGNTGVGLALVAAVKGYHCVFVLPDKMSSEKIRLLRAYGAKVVVTPSQLPPDHPMSHYSVARRLAKEIPNAYYPNQYENPENAAVHYRTTGPEIAAGAGEKLAAVVGTVGTGGTMSGVGRYFKEHHAHVRIVAVDPKGSVLGPAFRTGDPGKVVPYLVEGIGEDIVPKSIDFQWMDEFVEVGDLESFVMARRLAREEGMFVGGSSGSAVVGALRWLEGAPIPAGSTVVVILPDSGDRYLSKFYSDEWMREKGLLEPGAVVGDLLREKQFTPALLSVEPTTIVRDALETLRAHGISQVPVLAGDDNLGSVAEDDLLRASLADGTVADRTVSVALGARFSEVNLDTPVGEVVRRLKEERALLVRDPGTRAVVGLITRHDLLQHFSHHGAGHAL